MFDPLQDLVFSPSGICANQNLSDIGCLAFVMKVFFQVNVSQILMEGNDTLFPTRTANEWLGIIPEKAPTSTLLNIANVHGRGLPADTDSKFGFLYNSSKSTAEEAIKDWRLQTVRFNPRNLSGDMSLLQWNGNRILSKLGTAIEILNDGNLFAGWGYDIDFSSNYYLTPLNTFPDLQPNVMLNFWLNDGARPVSLVFNDSLSYKGVNAYEFTVSPSVLANSTDNHVFYFSNYLGLNNLSQAKYYAPLQISFPHFLDYPNIFQEFPLEGITPGSDVLHKTFVDVEPISGLVIRGAQRLQVNLLTLPYTWNTTQLSPGISLKPNLLLPLLWYETRSQLTDSDAEQLRQLQSLDDLKKEGQLICGLAGAALFVVGALMFLFARSRKRLAEEEAGLVEATPLEPQAAA